MGSSQLFRQWLLPHIGLLLLATGLALLVGGRWQAHDRQRQLEQQLQAAASGLVVFWQAEREGHVAAEVPDVRLKAAAERLQQQTGMRVTWLDGAGQVRADSSESLVRGGPLAPHPALHDARARGSATVMQLSAGGSVLYHAVRLGAADAPEGYVRVALPVDASAGDPGRLRWIALLLGFFGVSFVLTGLWTRQVVATVREVTRALGSIAGGQHRQSLVLAGPGELAELQAAVNQMSAALVARIAELRTSGERLATVLGSMVEAVLAVDSRQHVLFANGAARTLLEFHLTDPVGRPLWEVVRNRSVQQAAEAALASQEPYASEFEFLGRSRRVLALHATRLPGEPCPGVVIVLHEVTDLRRLETIRQEFVANVSHELKTPLAAIKAYCETLLHGAIADPENNVQFLRRIEEQGDRLHELILDLLSLARIESGQQGFEITAVVLDAVIASCTSSHRAPAQARQVQLDLEPPSRPVVVRADEEGVRQILDNLVDNALKYTPAGGRVIVRWLQADQAAWIEVADTGIGIPEPEQSRIFERFYRVDKARSRELGGTGLGLSIVKHLVQTFGGQVSVRSEVERGSTFRVELPLA